MIWHYTPHGRFTVSSAYKLGLCQTSQHQPSCSAPSPDWNVIWDCNIPPKVKIFAWQLCHQALATNKNVAHRGIHQQLNCLQCHVVPEDDVHLFLQCPYTKQAWTHTDCFSSEFLSKATSWLHLFHLILETLPEYPDALPKFIMCLWGLWTSRNQLVFAGKHLEASDSILKALCFLRAFQSQNSPASRPPKPIPSSRSHWFPPDPGWIMLNTDASYSSAGSGFGFVLRDQSGKVLKSGAGPLDCIQSVEHAELLAIWRSYSNISEYWFKPLIISTDCQTLVSQINCPKLLLSGLGGLVAGLKALLQNTTLESSLYF